jgi:hypothetical protein
MTRRRSQIAAALAALLVTLSLAAAVRADLLTDAIKIGGIGFAVSQFGKPINDAINKLTGTKGDDPHFSTKVVPILSAGQGTAIGACQVGGPKAAVDTVKAVAQIEGKFFGSVRIRALIPIAANNVSNIKRVQGVGITGLVDLKL